MITTFTGREVKIVGIKPEPYRNGDAVVIVEDVETGERRSILKSRLRASGGDEEFRRAVATQQQIVQTSDNFLATNRPSRLR